MNRRPLCLFLVFILLAGLAPAALAESPLDTYATGSFASKNLPVYTGPGEYYFRSNSGKAAYGGGSARIYGTLNGWLLIGYGLSNGDYRIGYIAADALESVNYLNGQVKELSFQPTVAYADDYCRLTDDPIMNNKMICTIPEGTAVAVLCPLGKAWTYVEVDTSMGLMRGFVWTKHLISASGDFISFDTPAPTATPRPYIPPTPYVTPDPRPAVTPILYAENHYYHDTTKGDWLPAYQELGLSGSWPVYSGPGVYYYRANNGRALMGGGSCRIYGVQNGWVMIGYSLSNGNYRIGYISQEALPAMSLYIPYLDLRYTTKRVVADVALTDDPVRYRPTVTALAADSYVVFLGYLYESGQTWAYVETLVDNSIMRGFVPAVALQ